MEEKQKKEMSKVIESMRETFEESLRQFEENKPCFFMYAYTTFKGEQIMGSQGIVTYHGKPNEIYELLAHLFALNSFTVARDTMHIINTGYYCSMEMRTQNNFALMPEEKALEHLRKVREGYISDSTTMESDKQPEGAGGKHEP